MSIKEYNKLVKEVAEHINLYRAYESEEWRSNMAAVMHRLREEYPRGEQ